MFFAYSCGDMLPQEGESNSKNYGPYIPSKPIIYTGDINISVSSNSGVEKVDGKALFSEADVSSNYTFSLENAPTALSVNSTSGELSVNVSAVQVGGLYDDIVIKAKKIIGTEEHAQTFSIGINGDPLRQYAWHLENTGQKTFSLTSADVGYDLNVAPVFADGITGDGVRIAVSDSGVETNHDDLIDNSLEGEHRDYSLNAPYIGIPVPTSAHGTAVTGIISAVGWNNFGSVGVAPRAKFAGFQFLDSLQSTDLLVHQASGNFDIFNYSYGDSIFRDTLSDADYLDHIKSQVINNNKVYVKAAGNEYLLESDGICTAHNANFPYENESPYVIVVGALAAASASPSNPTAIKASYSNTGSNIWVSAFGGEKGSTEPAILSTDLPTCFRGYSKAVSGLSNSFEYGHELNPDCHYTSTMNGTSSATPMVTGVIALMLEANSTLKQRDIKHILATTAVKVNPNHDDNYFGKTHPSNAFHSIYNCKNLNLTNHEYEQGWVKNAADYWFNNFYGFGMVDAKAAVDMAKTYSSNLGNLVEQNANFSLAKFKSPTLYNSQNNTNLIIPDFDANGAVSRINISAADALSVESVQVKVNVSHSQSGQLGIELTSPSGTKSILMNINNSFLLLDKNSDGSPEGDADLNIVLTSHAFYGEDSEGEWDLKLIDGRTGVIGSLNHWSINILGH